MISSSHLRFSQLNPSSILLIESFVDLSLSCIPNISIKASSSIYRDIEPYIKCGPKLSPVFEFIVRYPLIISSCIKIGKVSVTNSYLEQKRNSKSG